MGLLAASLPKGCYDGEVVTFQLNARNAQYPVRVSASTTQRHLSYAVEFGNMAGTLVMTGLILSGLLAFAQDSYVVAILVPLTTLGGILGIVMVVAPLGVRSKLRKVIRRFAANPRAVYRE